MSKIICYSAYHRSLTSDHGREGLTHEDTKITCKKCREIFVSHLEIMIKDAETELKEIKEEMNVVSNTIIEGKVCLRDFKRKWELK